MDFNSTVDLIIKDLNEAREIIDDLKNYPGVPALQVELAKSKCKSAADIIGLLKTIEKPVLAEKNAKPEASILPEKPAEPEKPVLAEEVKIQKMPEKKQARKEPEISVETELHVSVEKKEINTGIIADRFNMPTGLNEQLGSSREDGDISGLIKGKQVTSLSEVIGVNDKFLFIREIFNGSPESFEQALSAIESAQRFSEAREIIINREGIQRDSDAVKRLLNLVKRKFPADE